MTAIAGIIYGDSPTQGAIVGRIHPSGAEVHLHGAAELRLQMSQGRRGGRCRRRRGRALRQRRSAGSPMALADYLKSGWIAGLSPDTVPHAGGGFDTASGIAATDQWNFRVEVVRFEGRVYRFIFAARIDSELFAPGAERHDQELPRRQRSRPAAGPLADGSGRSRRARSTLADSARAPDGGRPQRARICSTSSTTSIRAIR